VALDLPEDYFPEVPRHSSWSRLPDHRHPSLRDRIYDELREEELRSWVSHISSKADVRPNSVLIRRRK